MLSSAARLQKRDPTLNSLLSSVQPCFFRNRRVFTDYRVRSGEPFLIPVVCDGEVVAGEVGRPVPDMDCTSAISELLINPLTVTSSRKLLGPTGCPDCD